MAGHSTWRVTGSRITGAVPEEVRAGQSRPPDLACTGQMRSSGKFRHAARSSFTASVTLEIRSAASMAVIQVSSCSPCRPSPGYLAASSASAVSSPRTVPSSAWLLRRLDDRANDA
jgi:hypothetical protein